MDTVRLLECLDTDVARLREVAVRDLSAPVPTCPEWTVEDLVRHVANLYQNVVVRRFRMAEDVPRQDFVDAVALDALDALDRCYAAMTTEFAARHPSDHVGREPYETVRFWIRRMAHETAIHRVDAELANPGTAHTATTRSAATHSVRGHTAAAHTAAVTPIPRDLAVDGIDEMMAEFLVPVTHLFPEEFADHLSDWAGRWVLVSAGDAAWQVTVRPDGADVTPVDVTPVDTHPADTHPTADTHPAGTHPPGDTRSAAAAAVHGDPDALMRWLYNRGGADRVVVDGGGDLIAQLRRLLTAVTNTA
jgi:hypothetical protein